MGWFSVFLFMQGPRTITRDPSAAMPNQLPINGAQICILAHTHHINSHTKSRRNRRRFRHKTRSRIAHGERVITRCGHCLAFYRRWSGLDFGFWPLDSAKAVRLDLIAMLSLVCILLLFFSARIYWAHDAAWITSPLHLLPQSIFYQQGKSPFWRKRSCSLNDLQMRFVFAICESLLRLGSVGWMRLVGERGDCSYLFTCLRTMSGLCK
jgi:hypothetical protein